MRDVEFCIGHLILHPDRQLLSGDRPVSINRKALGLLSVLARARCDLVTKDELMAALWDGAIVEENTLHAHIVAARKALGRSASSLTTVRGIGYRLAAREQVANTSVGRSGSIAVLPFINLTGDGAYDFLGEGIAEELISRLSQIAGLHVQARTSSFSARHREHDARTIARDLGVDCLLEGSIRKGGEALRIAAQLVDAQTGFHCWAECREHTFADALAVEDSIADALVPGVIAAVLDLPLKNTEKIGISQPDPVGQEACQPDRVAKPSPGG